MWARDDAGYAWLDANLTAERVRELLPEAADLEIRRYELANLRALNFVLVGYLGEGVASSTSFDPQAKGLGEYLRSRRVVTRQASRRYPSPRTVTISRGSSGWSSTLTRRRRTWASTRRESPRYS